jgi:hypothetical protein
MPQNRKLENFPKLIEEFKTTKRVHRLVKLHLIAGAQLALTWVCIWKPQTDLKGSRQREKDDQGFVCSGNMKLLMNPPRG